MAEKKTSLDFFLEYCANMSDGKILVFGTETTRNGIMFQIAFELRATTPLQANRFRNQGFLCCSCAFLTLNYNFFLLINLLYY